MSETVNDDEITDQTVIYAAPASRHTPMLDHNELSGVDFSTNDYFNTSIMQEAVTVMLTHAQSAVRNGNGKFLWLFMSEIANLLHTLEDKGSTQPDVVDDIFTVLLNLLVTNEVMDENDASMITELAERYIGEAIEFDPDDADELFLVELVQHIRRRPARHMETYVSPLVSRVFTRLDVSAIDLHEDDSFHALITFLTTLSNAQSDWDYVKYERTQRAVSAPDSVHLINNHFVLAELIDRNEIRSFDAVKLVLTVNPAYLRHHLELFRNPTQRAVMLGVMMIVSESGEVVEFDERELLRVINETHGEIPASLVFSMAAVSSMRFDDYDQKRILSSEVDRWRVLMRGEWVN